jgi:flagellar secretion chaperone FliS
MTRKIQNNYLEHEVLSADPVKLVRMLYRAAVDAVSEARVHLRTGAVRDRSRQINKALLIVHELLRSIDRESGGQIAKSLASLYVYMTNRLIEANAAQSEAPLAEVEQLLNTLLEGWSSLSMARAIEPEPEAEYEPMSCSY